MRREKRKRRQSRGIESLFLRSHSHTCERMKETEPIARPLSQTLVHPPLPPMGRLRCLSTPPSLLSPPSTIDCSHPLLARQHFFYQEHILSLPRPSPYGTLALIPCTTRGEDTLTVSSGTPYIGEGRVTKTASFPRHQPLGKAGSATLPSQSVRSNDAENVATAKRRNDKAKKKKWDESGGIFP